MSGSDRKSVLYMAIEIEDNDNRVSVVTVSYPVTRETEDFVWVDGVQWKSDVIGSVFHNTPRSALAKRLRESQHRLASLRKSMVAEESRQEAIMDAMRELEGPVVEAGD